MNNNINLFTTEELQEVRIEDYRGYWGEVVDETFDGLVQCLYDCGIIDNMEEYENE